MMPSASSGGRSWVDSQSIDTPIDDPANDLLNIDQQAQALAQYIRQHEEQLPFTVGVFGEWGEGKTTLVGLLYRHLCKLAGAENHEPLFIAFSAWPYTTSDKLWRALILEIAQVLYGRKKSGIATDKTKVPQRESPRQESVRIGWLTTITTFLAGDAIVLRDNAPDPDSYEELVRQLDETDYGAIEQRNAQMQVDPDAAMSAVITGTLAVLSTMSPLVAGLRSLFRMESSTSVSELAQKTTNQSTREAISSLARFQAIFRHMLKEKANNRTVYVFIDDLDRCQPNVALDILESVRVALTDIECVFIVAVDERLIAEGLRLRYKELFVNELSPVVFATKGQEYLEKIIQFRTRVPPRTVEQTQRFIAAQFPQWAVAGDILQAVIGSNPRRLKQYCHRLTFQSMVGHTSFALGLRRLGPNLNTNTSKGTGDGSELDTQSPLRRAEQVLHRGTKRDAAEELNAIDDLISTHRRRLRTLEKQKAMQGLDAPSSLTLEIEDIESELHNLDQQRIQVRVDEITNVLPPLREQLEKLEQQAASSGLATPPDIRNSLAEIQTSVAALENELTDLQSRRIVNAGGVESAETKGRDYTLSTYKRRLQQLEYQEAMYGASAPVQVLNEIADVREKIGQLESSLDAQSVPTFSTDDLHSTSLQSGNISTVSIVPSETDDPPSNDGDS
jgi:hypothetical protein